MGLAMATNLQKHLTKLSGPVLRYNNRTMSRGLPLQGLGATPCGSVADLVKLCVLIFVSVRPRSCTETSGELTS